MTSKFRYILPQIGEKNIKITNKNNISLKKYIKKKEKKANNCIINKMDNCKTNEREKSLTYKA